MAVRCSVYPEGLGPVGAPSSPAARLWVGTPCPPRGTSRASARWGEGPFSATGAAAPGFGSVTWTLPWQWPREGAAWHCRREQPVLLP